MIVCIGRLPPAASLGGPPSVNRRPVVEVDAETLDASPEPKP